MSVEYRKILECSGYQVGSDGTFWTCRKVVPKNLKGRIGCAGAQIVETDNWRKLVGCISNTGYRVVKVASRSRFLHVLVTEAFLGSRPEGADACHINGNKLDNRIENLRWGSRKENYADSVRHGTAAKGERNGKAKLSRIAVSEIRTRFATGEISKAHLARLYNVSANQIGLIVRGKNWADVPHIGG